VSHEISTPSISAVVGMCRRLPGRLADSPRTGVSGAAGPHGAWAFPGRLGRHRTRLIGQWLSERLGQPFIVENRPGASGDIATEVVVRAPADGYTLLVVLAANAINATLHDKLKFSPIRDLAMVAGMVRVPNVMEVHPAVPAKTVTEFIAYAKANPGRLSFASGGNGSSLHVIGELFKMMAGIDMLHVPLSRRSARAD
jgi:tripartite-type tricarboxylate transporter receptor subunit TctC